MLNLDIPSIDCWNEKDEVFVSFPAQKLQLEHSLLSIKKWESKWHKPFLIKDGKSKFSKTKEEMVDYIRCMTITPGVDPDIYYVLPSNIIGTIREYIENPMSATWFGTGGLPKIKNRNKEITAELIYCWMILLNIPVEFEKWHINQLLTLIKVVNLESTPDKDKRMNPKEYQDMRDRISEENKKRFNSKG